MKKLLGLSAACAAMLMFASGAALAQDHDNDYGHHDYRGYGQAHYATWRDRGRHEGWYHRGGYLPVEYRTRYVVTDWRRDRLREPPRGYRWVRSDSGDFLLVAITTGVIVDLILNH